ncbi:MAG TPA: hypothetical protein VFD22_04935, partial [Gemmatimonadaceae bacterium]|nr:hypothetical protein [Gemmatimonadaceae bacterium]
SEIYTSNADGTGIRRLTNNLFAEYDPQWSPDGTRIAFARSRDPEEPTEFFSPTNSDIYMMNADGSNVVQLTQGGTDWHPAWSPDGRKIAYAGWKNGYAVISVLDLSSGSNTSSTVGYDVGFNTDPAWLPGGHYITFSSDWYLPDFAPLIFQVRADGSEAPTLFFPATFDVSNSTSYRLGQPSWSPDGSRIAFAECEYFYGCWGSGSIVVMYNSRSGIKRVVETSNIAGISWSPDGAYIAYSSQTCRLCTPPSISYVSPDGTQKGLIISNAFSPSWTGSAR